MNAAERAERKQHLREKVSFCFFFCPYHLKKSLIRVLTQSFDVS